MVILIIKLNFSDCWYKNIIYEFKNSTCYVWYITMRLQQLLAVCTCTVWKVCKCIHLQNVLACLLYTLKSSKNVQEKYNFRKYFNFSYLSVSHELLMLLIPQMAIFLFFTTIKCLETLLSVIIRKGAFWGFY